MTNKNITIRNIKTFLTEPNNIRLITVKVETSEPELYGIGDATFTQRPTAVYSAINDYLKPFLLVLFPTESRPCIHVMFIILHISIFMLHYKIGIRVNIIF